MIKQRHQETNWNRHCCNGRTDAGRNEEKGTKFNMRNLAPFRCTVGRGQFGNFWRIFVLKSEYDMQIQGGTYGVPHHKLFAPFRKINLWTAPFHIACNLFQPFYSLNFNLMDRIDDYYENNMYLTRKSRNFFSSYLCIPPDLMRGNGHLAASNSS